MAAEARVSNPDRALEALQALDLRTLASMERAQLSHRLAPVVTALRNPGNREHGVALADAALRACQLLHTGSRSREALTLAREAFAFGKSTRDAGLQSRA